MNVKFQLIFDNLANKNTIIDNLQHQLKIYENMRKNVQCKCQKHLENFKQIIFQIQQVNDSLIHSNSSKIQDFIYVLQGKKEYL